MTKLSFERHAFLVKSATYASVSVAVILIIAKFFAWVATDAVALQATLVDSLLDALASFLNMIAVSQALKPADHEHRFGHGKIEAIAALGQSVFIAGSAVWLLFEAIHRFIHPQVVIRTDIGIFVMILAIVLTGLLILYQNHVVKRTRSTAILADSVHYRSDLLINGSVIVSLGAGSYFGFLFLDPTFGTLIAFYILYTSWKIAAQAFHMLIDRELSNRERERILEIAFSHPDVLGCHDLRTRTAGSQEFIQLHLEMNEKITLEKAHTISFEVTQMILKDFPHAEVLIHQDPYYEKNKRP